MTHKSFRSKSALSHVLLMLLFLISNAAVAPASSATGLCDAPWAIDLPGSEHGSAVDGTATFSLEASASRWLVVEAQRTDLDPGRRVAERPTVRVFDPHCRELDQHPTLPHLLGRHIHFVERSGPIYVRIETDDPRATFRLHAWLGSGRNELSFNPWSKNDPDPVPQEPVDEWDELHGSLTKDGDPDPVPQEPVDEWDELRSNPNCRTTLSKNDPDPVPQEPVDEWDELRTGPGEGCGSDSRAQAREIPGIGILASTRQGMELRSLCSWAANTDLLGTLTCARTLQLEDSGQTLVRSIGHHPEMLALDLDRPTSLSLIGADQGQIFDAVGRRVPTTENTEGHADGDPWDLPAGRYYLEVHGSGSDFLVSTRFDSTEH